MPCTVECHLCHTPSYRSLLFTALRILWMMYPNIFIPSLSHEHCHCSHFLALEIVLSWASWNNAQEFHADRNVDIRYAVQETPAMWLLQTCTWLVEWKTELLINRKSKSAPLVLPKGRGMERGGLVDHCSKANEQARLVERKVCWILDASNLRGRAAIFPKTISPHDK